MSDDLVKRLRHGIGDAVRDHALMQEAADRIEALEARAEKAEAERDALREAVTQILTLDRGVAPEVRDADAALDAWWSNLCAQYREIARAALNRQPDT